MAKGRQRVEHCLGSEKGSRHISSRLYNQALAHSPWDLALKLLHQMPPLCTNQISYTHAIKACANSAKWREALTIVQSMRIGAVGAAKGDVTKTHIVTPNVMHYNGVLSACEKAGHWEVALSVIEEMNKLKHTSIEPDAVSYNCVIATLAKSGHWQRAFQIFDQLCSGELGASLQPSVVTYAVALKACEEALLWQRALTVLDALHDAERNGQLKEAANIIHYNSTLNVLAKAAQWKLAMKLLRRIPSPDVISYNTVISACDKAGEWETALRVLYGLKKTMRIMASTKANETDGGGGSSSSTAAPVVKIVRPDVVSYNSAISACEKGHQWELTVRLLRDMCRIKHMTPDVVSFTAAISACGKARQWGLALELLQTALQRVRPDVIIYNACMSACAHAGKWEHALTLLHELRQAASSTDSRDGKEITNRARHATPCVPTSTSYGVAIDACTQGAMYAVGVRVFEEMVQEGTVPTFGTYKAVITACVEGKFNRRAVDFYREAVKSATVPYVRKEDNVVDFHGFNIPMATVALWCVFDDLKKTAAHRGKNDNAFTKVERDLIVITGRGNGSLDEQSVLRPRVIEILDREFQPSLDVRPVPGNDGRLRILASSLQAWLDVHLQ
eukprot:GEMP01010980.1.p1 GENE.GEMP01010980.1~~GEMP01010980.1.p1  ORF type:complete len:618 (+),score=142.76 GEMP01010980.1:258-2111(+)